MDEINQPVAAYRSELREAHARHTAAYFEELLQRSAVDEAANAHTIAALGDVGAALKASGRKSLTLKIARGVLVGLAILGVVGALSGELWWAVLPVLAVWVIVQPVNPMLREAQGRANDQEAEQARLMAEAWAQMEPLNRLYTWDIAATLLQRTVPLITLDPYCTDARLQELRGAFGWDDRLNTVDRSVTFTHSGTLIGNPFVLGQSNLHWMSTKTYTGSLVISWTETYRDSQGRTQVRRRSETLTASVTKPAPAYQRESFLLYGSEAAPELSFTREPSSLSGVSDGMIGTWRKGRAVKKLEARARKLDGFTVMSNQEFDALFQATDRDHEVQFRLLFTPLAQQEMLNVLKDREAGFGDDFRFYKWRMVNVVIPEHLSQIDIGLGPDGFRNHDLAVARHFFNEYHNAFFRSLFFSFAPILTIPLYQQHRSFQDIYRGVLAWRPSFWEVESLVNAMGESTFAHPASATSNILKVATDPKDDGVDEVAVTAYGFRTEDRVDYVRVWGGDGRWHNVPVPWTEYIPVERTSSMLVFNCRDPQSMADVTADAEEPAWRLRMQTLGVDPSGAAFHRSLAGVLLR
jgi:hypothetical protein